MTGALPATSCCARSPVAVAGDSNLVAPVGGVEFAVLLTQMPDSVAATTLAKHCFGTLGPGWVQWLLLRRDMPAPLNARLAV